MNYKNIAWILFLLPVASYGNQMKSHIKELEEAQIKKSLEALEISKLIVQKATSYLSERNAFSGFWELTLDTQEEDDLFGEFLNEFSEVFYSGGDIDSLIEKKPLKKENIEDLKFSLIQIAIEKFFYKQAISKYDKLINELTDINIELNTLKSRST